MPANKRWLWRSGAAVVIAAVVGATVLLNTSPSSGLLLAPDSQPIVTRGQQLYEAQCASCHGVNLEGQFNWRNRKPDGRLPAPPHSEQGHTWHHPEQVLFEITKYGLQKFAGEDYETDMPAYENVLTDDEIIAILSYIKSRWPAEIRQQHDQISTPPQ